MKIKAVLYLFWVCPTKQKPEIICAAFCLWFLRMGSVLIFSRLRTSCIRCGMELEPYIYDHMVHEIQYGCRKQVMQFEAWRKTQ